MFCGNCGTQLTDGQRFCQNCGSPVPVQPVAPAPAEVPVQQPVYEQPPVQQPVYEQSPVQQPVYEQPSVQYPTYEQPGAVPPPFEVNVPADETPKKKGKGGKIGLIIIAVLLVGAIVLAAVCWGDIMRFFKRATMEPTDYIVEVEKKAAADTAKTIGDAYDSLLQSADVTDMSNRSTLTLKVSDSVLTMLESLLSEEGVDLDLDWVESISLDMDTTMNANKFSADIGIALNSAHLLTLSLIGDMDSNKLWMTIPELNTTYLEMSMDDVVGEDMSDLYPSIMEAQTLSAEMLEAMPSGEEVEKLINTYVGIVLDHVKDVEKSEETFRLNGLEQDLLVMTAQFSEADFCDIVIAVLEEARDDELLKDTLVGFAEIAGEDGEYLAEIYADSVDEILAEMENTREEASEEKVLKLETILDDKDNIVGRTISGEDLDISYITVVDGDAFAFQAEVDSMATVTGEGTIKKGKTTGKFVLEVMDQEYITLEVEDYSSTDKGVTGTFVLTPEGALLEELYLDGSALQMLGGTLGLKMFVDSTADTPTVSYGLLAAGTELFSIEVTSENGEARSVKLPENAVDVNNDVAGMMWLAGLKLDTLLGNLEQAGLPEEYMAMLEQVAEMFASEFQ